jgi:hypothetical protein
MFDPVSRPRSWGRTGFVIGGAVVLLLNLLAVQMRSDGGILALLGLCYDCILRVGFPWVLVERGGLAYHESFVGQALLGDILVGVGVWVVCGLVAVRILGAGQNDEESELLEDGPD